MKNYIQKQEIQINLQGTKRRLAIEKENLHLLSEGQKDTNFGEELTSIGFNIRTDLDITWRNVQQFTKEANYSENIKDLKQPQYCNKSITNCLLLMNWYTPSKFSLIFTDRIVSKLRFYEYIVLLDGVLTKIFINSKVPIKDGKILFAELVENSVFPSLIEKATAKCFGCYEDISQNLVKLLQLWTWYALQSFNPKHYTATQFISFFQCSLKDKNLTFFRVRNSVRLQQLGFSPNQTYLIVRVLKIQQQSIIQFLQLNDSKWKGKCSVGNDFWSNKDKQIRDFKIQQNKLQNYIQIGDLLHASREIIILHNTESYNINWVKSDAKSLLSSQQISHCQSKNIFQLILSSKDSKPSHVMISFHFLERLSRNSAFIMKEENCELVACSFKELKDSNFISAFLEPGTKYLLYLYSQDQEGKKAKANITVYSHYSWCEIKEVYRNVAKEQRCFLNFMQSVPGVVTKLQKEEKSKSSIIVKNMFEELGMGFIIVSLDPQFKKNVTISYKKEKFKEIGLGNNILCPLPFNHNDTIQIEICFQRRRPFSTERNSEGESNFEQNLDD